MKYLRIAVALGLSIFGLASTLLAQSMPPIKAKALDDSEVVLPKPGGQQFLILVLGFSHKSGEIPTSRTISYRFLRERLR